MLKDKRLYIIFSITLIAVMGVASLTPAFPKISMALKISKTDVALLISAFTFPGIFLVPFTGVIADRWGRKRVMIPSLFLFAVAGSAGFFIHDFTSLIVLRVLQGAGAASLGSLNVTLIGDFFKGKERSRAMGYNASVLSIFTAIYPLIGGFMAAFAWYYPFLLPILAIPVGLVVIFSLDEPEFQKVSNFTVYLKAVYKSIFQQEVLSIFILSTLTFIILYGAILTYIPFLLSQNFNLTAPEIGIFLSLSSLTTAVVALLVGKLTVKFGSLNLIKVAFLMYLITAIIIPHISNIYMFIAPILLFGSAQALNIPSLQTVLADLSPDDQRGVFMSINGMVLRLGQTLGPVLIGLGYTFGDFKGAYYLSGFMALAGLVVLFTLSRNLPSK